MKLIKKIKKTTLILAVIILFGAALRGYQLGEKTFTGDEFFDINAIYGYRMTGEWQPWDFNLEAVEKDPSLSSATVEFRNERSWIYRWQIVQLFHWLAPTESVARLASVFWSLVSIILIYGTTLYFSRNRTVALLAAFLFSVNISALIIARTLRMYAMFLPLFLLFSWSLFRFLEEEYRGKSGLISAFQRKWGVNLRWSVPVLGFGALSAHLQPLAVSIVPILGVYCLLEGLQQYWRDGKWRNKYLIISAGILLLGIIAGIFFRETAADYLSFPESFRKAVVYLRHFASNFSYYPLVLLIMVGGFYFFREQKKERNWIVTNFLVSTILGMFAWSLGAFDRYLYFVKPFELILVAAGMYQGALWVGKINPENSKRLFVVALAAFCLLIPNYAYFWSDENIYANPVPKDELDYRSVFSYIAKKGGAGDVLVTRNYRSYYFPGYHYRVLNFGGEMNIKNKKLGREELEKFVADNPSGWVVIPERDQVFLRKDALDFIRSHMEPVENKAIKGEGLVYRWPSSFSR